MTILFATVPAAGVASCLSRSIVSTKWGSKRNLDNKYVSFSTCNAVQGCSSTTWSGSSVASVTGCVAGKLPVALYRLSNLLYFNRRLPIRTVYCSSESTVRTNFLHRIFQDAKSTTSVDIKSPLAFDTAPHSEDATRPIGKAITGLDTCSSSSAALGSSSAALGSSSAALGSSSAALGSSSSNSGKGICGVAQIAANAPIQDRHFFKIFDAAEDIPKPTDVVRSSHSSAAANEVIVGAVIDGHGGWQIADAVKRKLPQYISNRILPLLRDCDSTTTHSTKQVSDDVQGAIVGAFNDLDLEFREALAPATAMGFSRAIKCGACVCCVFVTNKSIIVANTGDCKAVLSRYGVPVPLSKQHSADVVEERLRIRAAHPNEEDAVVCKKSHDEPRTPTGFWQYPIWRVGRLGSDTHYSSCYVKGRLQPSRSFGDFHLKTVDFAYDHDAQKFMVKTPHSFPYITVEPEVTTEVRTGNSDEFIILASDGVWDFLDDKEAVETVRRSLVKRGVLLPTPYPDSSSKAALVQDPYVTKQAAAEAATALVDAVLLKAEVTRDEATAMSPKEKRQKFDDTTVCVVLL